MKTLKISLATLALALVIPATAHANQQKYPKFLAYERCLMHALIDHKPYDEACVWQYDDAVAEVGKELVDQYRGVTLFTAADDNGMIHGMAQRSSSGSTFAGVGQAQHYTLGKQ